MDGPLLSDLLSLRYVTQSFALSSRCRRHPTRSLQPTTWSCRRCQFHSRGVCGGVCIERLASFTSWNQAPIIRWVKVNNPIVVYLAQCLCVCTWFIGARWWAMRVRCNRTGWQTRAPQKNKTLNSLISCFYKITEADRVNGFFLCIIGRCVNAIVSCSFLLTKYTLPVYIITDLGR